MERQFKRPNKLVLFLFAERIKPLDGVALFTSGAAVGYASAGQYGIMAVDIAVTLAALLVNHIVNRKMRSYR